MRRSRQSRWQLALLGASLAGLAAGGLLHLLDAASTGRLVWAATTLAVVVPTTLVAVRQLARRDVGVDLIAVLAMAGALLLQEYLAGAIIAVMLTGGASLEHFAVARARRELSALLERAPRLAHRREGEDPRDR